MDVQPLWYRRPRTQAWALFVFGFLLYANTLGHGFALDDAIVITDNEIVQRGVAGWPQLFSNDTFYGFFGEAGKDNLVAGGRYRPLTPALFALESQMVPGPFLHHLLNVFWYALLVVVLFYFLRDLVDQRDIPWWFALAVAALFAAHPIHTEAVANIKGRDEILALLGGILACWSVWRWSAGGAAGAGGKPWKYALASALSLFFGCLSKENAITFVAVIPVMLYAFRGASFRWADLKYGVPALLAAVAFLALRTSVIGLDFAEPTLEPLNNPFLVFEEGRWIPMDWGTRLATVFHTLWRYLVLLTVPVGLVHDYYPAAVSPKSWTDITPILGLAIYLGLGIRALWRLRSSPIAAFGILFYLITLSIVSNLFFSVGTFMSERFVFIPSFGIVLLWGALAVRLGQRFRVAPWVLMLFIGVFSVLTLLRNPVWQNNFVLFTHDVERQPDSAKLLNAAGGVRVDTYQGLPEEERAARQDLLTLAERDLTRALSIHPTYRNAYLLRGNARLLLQRYDEAIADYDRALDISDQYQAALDNLVVALQRAGQAAGEQRQDLTASLRYLQRAQQIEPNNYETLRLLGVANGVGGNVNQALTFFRRAAELKPQSADAAWNYAIALLQTGRAEEAEVEFQRAEQLQPGIRARRGG